MFKIQENVPLASYTTLKVGGSARYFVEINHQSDLKKVLMLAKKKEWNVFVLAGGSNVLISDQGFNGLVIKLNTQRTKIITESQKKIIIEVDAGVSLNELVNLAYQRGWSGLEWAIGIPGTLGGAVYNNAGAFSKTIGELVIKVKVLRKQNNLQLGSFQVFSDVIKMSAHKCKFSYRSSIFKEEKKWILLSAILNLKIGEKKIIEKKQKEYLKKRQDKQPNGFSAGSFFKNPRVDNKKLILQFEKEKGIKSIDQKIPAGWFIEKLGIKGKKIGGAQISEKHANFLINTGNATAEDFIILAGIIKQKVRNHFGVQLKEEVEMIGF